MKHLFIAIFMLFASVAQAGTFNPDNDNHVQDALCNVWYTVLIDQGLAPRERFIDAMRRIESKYEGDEEFLEYSFWAGAAIGTMEFGILDIETMTQFCLEHTG